MGSALTSAADFFTNCAGKSIAAGGVSGRLAPYWGYRSTTLSKEMFVYRPSSLRTLPEKLQSLKETHVATVNLLSQVMRELLLALEWPEEQIHEALAGVVEPVHTERDMSYSSFLEVFRYDCSPGPGVPLPEETTYRFACGEHRDTSLLTMLPHFSGDFPGVEVYNWATGEWHCEEKHLAKDEALIFAGE